MLPDAGINFDDFDFADFAQEFLRRNANYRAEFHSLNRGAMPDLQSQNSRMMARSWGLEFRSFTRSWRKGSPGYLACDRRAVRNHR